MYPSPLFLAFINMLWTTLCGDWLYMYGSHSPNRWFEVQSITSLWSVSNKEINKSCFILLCQNNIGHEVWIHCPSGPRSPLRLDLIGIGRASMCTHLSNTDEWSAVICCDNNNIFPCHKLGDPESLLQPNRHLKTDFFSTCWAPIYLDS